jgi:ribose 5-phosphate isomerase A
MGWVRNALRWYPGPGSSIDGEETGLMGNVEENSAESIKKLKEEAAESAAALIKDGMVIGLGSGTTATLLVAAIGKRVKEGLRVVGVPTSEQTAEEARRLNIPLSTLAENPQIDLALDGADEVELGTLDLTKGGGGNLLREKLVAIASARFVIVVDERKLVEKLGSRYSLSVDVVQFGWQTTARRLEDLGAVPKLRLQANGETFVTDGGQYILDCAFGPIPSGRELAAKLDGVVGVVEHGLFIGMTTAVVVGRASGVTVLTQDKPK